MSDAKDRQATAADSLRSEGQSDDIQEAVQRGLDENLSQGKPQGKRAPGYRIVRDERTGIPIRREPVPEMALVLQEAAREVIDSSATVSMTALAKRLAPQWQAAGGEGAFRGLDLKRMLVSPTTAGLRVHYGEVVRQGTWDPILTMQQHERLRVLLCNPARLSHHGSDVKWLLTSIALCGVCVGLEQKSVIRRQKPQNRHKSDRYACSQWHVARDMRRVDDHVTELLMQLLETPDALAKLYADDATAATTMDEELAFIQKVRAAKEEWVRDAIKLGVSPASVAAYEDDARGKIAAAKARINALVGSPLLTRVIGENARLEWAELTLLERREVIRGTVTVTINRVERRGRWSDIGVTVRPIGSLNLT